MWMCSLIFAKQRFIQDKILSGSQMLGVTSLWPTHSLMNTYLGPPLCLRLLLCQVEPLLKVQNPPSLVAPSSAYGMCTKLAAVKIIQLRNASDTVVNDPNWKTRQETQIFSVLGAEGWIPCATGGGLAGTWPTFTTNSLYSQVCYQGHKTMSPLLQ